MLIRLMKCLCLIENLSKIINSKNVFLTFILFLLTFASSQTFSINGPVAGATVAGAAADSSGKFKKVFLS